jgi:type VI secretion system protein ImpC
MVRDKIGSSMTQAQLQSWLNEWIKKYIEASPDTATEEAKAMRPLSAAEVVVEEDPSNPGYYTSKIFLKPHYQLEGLTVSLRLVSKLPSQKG